MTLSPWVNIVRTLLANEAYMSAYPVFVLRCKKHRWYRGIYKTKRDCEHCREVYRRRYAA